ncbi:MAG TPA: permease, partial [Alteromonas macleodii]|nr:permease [Alteromonas macleodii]
SCGVIPAALGLRRSGASKSSTISFLVSTPETGVDSVSVSYALLGPLYAIVRPIAAITSAIYAGLMVRFFAEAEEAQQRQSDVTQSSCCGSKQAPKPEPQIQASTSCCASEKTHAHNHESTDKPTHESSPSKITSVLSYASGKLLEDIVIWLLIGLALAAAIKTWVPTDFLTQWGDGVVAMLVMSLIGIPMYICATASTPLAVGFLAAGVSP